MYMVGHALDRGHDVVAVGREQSVAKLAEFDGRITVMPAATDDRAVIQQAVAGCDGVLVVLVPQGMHHYASGTAQAVLDHAEPEARLVFSCGWHITPTDTTSTRGRSRPRSTSPGALPGSPGSPTWKTRSRRRDACSPA